MSFWVDIFLCEDMFPYEDSKTVSVCPYPEKRNRPTFVNNSPTIINDTWTEKSSRVLYISWETKKIIFLKKKHAYLSVSAVMFCKQFLASRVDI